MEKNTSKNKLSIITTTYNRGYILGVLYNSLCSQSCKNFEWIIIDDGSTDDTSQLVGKWKSENNDFEINCFSKLNGGKHRALNDAFKKAKYDYIYIVDSDDYITNTAVEKIYKWIGTIDDDIRFAGVSGLRGYQNGAKIIGQFPQNKSYIDASNLQRKRKKLIGDKAEIYRRDILLKYPFPEFEGEKFLGEAAVWNKIAGEGYLIRWFGEVICLCEYLNDGLTRNFNQDVLLSNFEGYTYNEKLNVRYKRFLDRFLAIGRYIELANRKNLSHSEIKERLEITNGSFWLGALFGFLRRTIKSLK